MISSVLPPIHHIADAGLGGNGYFTFFADMTFLKRPLFFLHVKVGLLTRRKIYLDPPTQFI